MDEREIGTSKLGTENYWNEFYNLEINNFEDTGDQGECWFGKSLLNKVIKWIKSSNQLNEDSKILDIGCGNGLFLFELVKLNFKQLIGIDYSENSIKFSNLILDRDYSTFKENVKFKKINILEFDNFNDLKEFNLVFDKGTYDAICLNPDKNYTLDQLKLKYKEFLNNVLVNDGLFILCSCNWSRDELIKDFIDNIKIDNLKLNLIDEIKQTSFVFGGKIGHSTTCLIFKKEIKI